MRLSVQGVGKKYRNGFWGVEDMSLDIGPGVFGFLGPNGAGKSTLMRIIASITRPTTGTVRWNGQDIWTNLREYRKKLGYLPQDFGVYPQLSPVEFLHYIAGMKGITGKDSSTQIQALLQLVNLEQARNMPIGKMSGGMKQRVGIAQALLGSPRILIVDEPTVGLDPEERLRFRNLLSDLAEERIVIFSTHIVSDIEATAACIAIVSGGRLMIHTTPEELLQKVRGKVWEVMIPGEALLDFRKHWQVGNTVRTAEGVRVRVIHVEAPVPGAQAVEPTLEDAYLYFISRDRAGADR